MSDNLYKEHAFLDTNVLIYLYSSDEAEKRLRAASVFKVDASSCLLKTWPMVK